MNTDFIGIPAFYFLAICLGGAGQTIRGGLGLLKRFRDDGSVAFNPAHFSASLCMGGIAGLLGALVFDLRGSAPGDLSFTDLWDDRNYILMAISAGYFGADVIEGVLGAHAPGDPKRSVSGK